MTPKERAAMQQALKAMEDASPYGLTFKEAVAALREALELTKSDNAVNFDIEHPYADKAAMFEHMKDMVRIDPVTGNVGIGTPSEQSENNPAKKEYSLGIGRGSMMLIDTTKSVIKTMSDDEYKTLRSGEVHWVDTGTVDISCVPHDWDKTFTPTEQEPVAWGRVFDGDIIDCICPEEHALNEGVYTTPLYSHPVRTKDLTDAEIGQSWVVGMTLNEFARLVIAKDREKNK